jgi:uncharacterized RmlC-like cupin family protein
MRMSDQTSKPGLGPIGTKVLFENDHIRVWSIELPPKGHQPLHEHHNPYLIVPITKGKSVMKWPDGRERELIDVPGDVKFREPAGGPHELFNLENADFHCVLVEVKGAGKPG